MAYITNTPYSYPADNGNILAQNTAINTGWHAIPNCLWRTLVTPKQWAELQIDSEAYHVQSIDCTIFNMIPMTTQMAIQGNTLFTAFNNTIYAIAYKDELYETSWEPWTQPENLDKYGANLAWKEGLYYVAGTTTKHRYMLPVYTWKVPKSRTTSSKTWNFANNGTDRGQGVFPSPGRPSGIFWDPLNRPDHIMELRPGKNAIHFSWTCHPTDENIWFNMDQLASWYPYVTAGPYANGLNRPNSFTLSSMEDPDLLASKYQNNPTINDYTIPNWASLPLVPCGWWWKEMQQSLIDTDPWNQKPDLHFPGTEYEQYKYPPTQFFIKLIPLFDANNTNVEITAQVSIKTTLTLQIKPRRSALYCPTWGPFSWHNLYSAQTENQNYINSFIRYRTGGARRTWQNLTSDQGENDTSTSYTSAHPRQTPYWTTTVAAGTGASGTFTTTTTNIDSRGKSHITVTFNKDLERVVMHAPVPKRRTEKEKKSREPSPEMSIQMSTFQHITQMEK